MLSAFTGGCRKGKPSEILARSRHSERITFKSEHLPDNVSLPVRVFRVKTYEANMASTNALFFLSIFLDAEKQGILF